MRLSFASFLGAAIALGSIDNRKPNSLQQKIAAPRPIHNEGRFIKRLSPPVCGDAVDIKQYNRIGKARVSTCLGELRAGRKLNRNAPEEVRLALIGKLRRKHNLLPRATKHNARP